MNAPRYRIWEKDNREMALIPAGTFEMGCDEGSGKHRPRHSVSVQGFYIDRYPVTNQAYKRFIDQTSYPVPYYEVSWCDTRGYNWDRQNRTFPPGKAHHPVVLVTWKDALAYAQWAGKRFPTEAEWERAARGADRRIWSWGNENAISEQGERRSNTRGSGIGGTTPVDRYVPQGDSPYGVSDMIGNVWEWTSSLFKPYPYDSHDGREDLMASGWRVLRGGSWTNDLFLARCYTRLDGDFVFYNNVGFRCAVSAELLE